MNEMREQLPLPGEIGEIVTDIDHQLPLDGEIGEVGSNDTTAIKPPEPEKDEIYLKDKYFEMVKSGQKTVDLRIGWPSNEKIIVGQTLTIATVSGEKLDAVVTGIAHYRTVNEIPSDEIHKNFPGATPEEVERQARILLNPGDVAAHGLIAIEFKLVEK